jgi:hypothetical protein
VFVLDLVFVVVIGGKDTRIMGLGQFLHTLVWTGEEEENGIRKYSRSLNRARRGGGRERESWIKMTIKIRIRSN